MSPYMKWSRRQFIRDLSLGGGALAFGAAAAAKMPSIAGRLRADGVANFAPVVSFHLDQPYIDPTGAARAYRPPAGAQGGAPVASLSDAELARYYGFI